MLYSYQMLGGSLGAPGSSPDFSSYLFIFFPYCTTLKHEFAVEFIIFTNQNLSEL